MPKEREKRRTLQRLLRSVIKDDKTALVVVVVAVAGGSVGGGSDTVSLLGTLKLSVIKALCGQFYFHSGIPKSNLLRSAIKS